MQDKRYAYIFLTNGQLLNRKTTKKKTLAGWECVAFERFVYNGDRFVYRKLRRRLTGEDKQLHAKKGEPPKGWVDPIGWIAPDSGEPWLTINDKGELTVREAAAKRLRSAKNSSPPRCGHLKASNSLGLRVRRSPQVVGSWRNRRAAPQAGEFEILSVFH